MKLIVSKTAIEMAVKNICRVINAKNALPILGDILCMVDEQQKTITMTGSDSEAWLHYKVQLQECEGGGSFCIGAGDTYVKKQIARILNRNEFTADYVSWFPHGNNIEIWTDNVEFKEKKR